MYLLEGRPPTISDDSSTVSTALIEKWEGSNWSSLMIIKKTLPRFFLKVLDRSPKEYDKAEITNLLNSFPMPTMMI